MNIFTPEIAQNLLLQEYPLLVNNNLTIKKQYQTSNGRMYNTFLVESSKSGFEKFTAKGIVLKQNGLELEWTVLNLLQENDIYSPKLLIPGHKPENFMLLQLIEGQSAADAVLEENGANKVFEQVGIAVGKLHSTKVNNFGNILNPQKINWSEYLKQKLKERSLGIKTLVPSQLFEGAAELCNSFDKILEKESREQPVLIHRDIYLDNFIVTENSEQAILIDYGMAMGGRPFYDLGKFYITELYKRPTQKNTFLEAYSKFIPFSSNFNELMKLYILNEVLGMIGFFNSINDDSSKVHAIQVLEELVENKDVMAQLLN